MRLSTEYFSSLLNQTSVKIAFKFSKKRFNMNTKIKIILNKELLIVLSALFICFILYSPFLMGHLRGYKPELRFLGDLQIAGYPSFIYARNLAMEYAFYGMDFLTANGSSSLFLRPNFGVYYLPQFILLNSIGHIKYLSDPFLFVILLYFNAVVCMIFTALFCSRMLKFNLLSSLFCGVLFTAFSAQTFGQITFLNVASIFPAVLYSFFVAADEKLSLKGRLILSIPLISIVTGGYLPIALMGVVVAFGTFLVLHNKDRAESLKAFFINLFPGILLSFLYVSCLLVAVSIVPQIPKIPLGESLFYQDLSITAKGLISIFFPPLQRDGAEAPHFLIGLPLIICYLVAFKHAKVYNRQPDISFTAACLIIFLLSIVLSMGRFSGLAGLFFYSIPALGTMHAYGRYMLIFSFFFALGIGYYFSKINDNEIVVPNSIYLIIILMIASCILFPEFISSKGINIIQLEIEILYCVLILLCLNLGSIRKVMFGIIIVVASQQASFIYAPINWINLSNPGNTSIDLLNNQSRKNALIEYMLVNSKKKLIKYIDLTPEIEKHGGVQHNFPWHIKYNNSERRISSYMGYEQGLSMQLEYAQRFSYFGKYDAEYLKSSGVDFIVYDEKTLVKENLFIKELEDREVKRLDIGYGYFISKVNHVNLQSADEVFNNGLIKIISKNSDLKVEKFQTNWRSFISVSLASEGSSSLSFLMFPHKFWKFYVDGNEVQPQLSVNNLASFEIPAGSHNFKIKYSFNGIKYFAFIYIVFILLTIFLIIGSLMVKLFGLRFKLNSMN